MIYLDSSVALAEVFTEERRPVRAFWQQPIASSRLLQFEVWNRVLATRAGVYRQQKAQDVLEGAQLIDMSSVALARALRPFPLPVRTLDGLHLATMDHLREQGLRPRLASYDIRLLAAAEAMGFDTVQP